MVIARSALCDEAIYQDVAKDVDSQMIVTDRLPRPAKNAGLAMTAGQKQAWLWLKPKGIEKPDRF